MRPLASYPRKIRCLPPRLTHLGCPVFQPSAHPSHTVRYVTVTGQLLQSPNRCFPPRVRPGWVPAEWSHQPHLGHLVPSVSPSPSSGPHLTADPTSLPLLISTYPLASEPPSGLQLPPPCIPLPSRAPSSVSLSHSAPSSSPIAVPLLLTTSLPFISTSTPGPNFPS